MIELTITPPNHPLSGKVEPPGSKSITNRVLLLAGLATGRSVLTGALKSDDTLYMAEALRAMGVDVTEPDATSFVVESSGVLTAPTKPLFLGNAGTATRFLTAAVAAVDGTVVVDGDEHMRKRPIQPLVEALNSLGIEAEAAAGCPPVTVKGNGQGFVRDSATIDANLSSQYVSALLMAAPCGAKPLDIVLAGEDIGAKGYIDLTVSAMEAFGATVERVSNAIWRVHPTGYKATDFHIEPDASAATYLWGAELLTGGTIDIGTPADAFTQPDAKAYAVMAQFPNLPAEIDGSQMQDAIPTIAVLAAYNTTPVRFVGIANLRVKECDRIRALSLGLNGIREGLGEEDGDDLIVHADPELAGQTVSASIDTFHDHRIAMSFALAGLKTGGIAIQNPACVGKTYPGYWKALGSLGVDYSETGQD
ncbi:3-phosphoshikimate 1-carboxyvinyltransferase [Agrobacterium rubi TR3 = NBRC 13261]|uniref:3-phosphoshikimate 1-carboxyvinyltransferase n=1 Tax=Agrobacterium rubi TR3 = NBRC 13261 TaxID=1368415 RepID=A0A081D3F9_9HYPH|nr:3-phosphoshikimate 1-carboxyvinyltransferase [Agrobacterium rubi]MBP1880097.1 3-phosphoshikimate 1-carboxyvinyltransferase [Agrobacterium rubi]MCL6653827.1 3-phosphoshikimate 1-carboxyvinyltransferase [Agrobacterium rubi]GAK73455.1 3-phosphoshikimate 1-carboxyvinyltransferase [Agrobacterium rubi TR3 = NBRC 13261]